MPHPPYTVGLTGNIACGKSTVGRMVVELGADYVDTDALVHDLLAGDSPQAHQIVARFGAGVAKPGGGINRAALGTIVFADRAALRDLEGILHPRVEELVHERIASSCAPIIVIDGVKIFETGLARELDELWVVICDPEVQRQRLEVHRGLTPLEAEARLRSQPPLEAKLAYARVVIDNSGSIDQTREMVEAAMRRILMEIEVG